MRPGYALACLVAGLLAACGGGGGGGVSTPAPTAVTQFPLQAAYKAYASAAHSVSYTISGTCSGTGTNSNGAPTAATFEGSPALAVTSTVTLQFTNCTPATATSTGVDYFDSNFIPLGESVPGSSYSKYIPVPNALPATVKIGDTAVYGDETDYTDSTKATTTGHTFSSYAVEADGSSTTTAVINLVTRSVDTSNQTLYTEQDRYRITADGSLTPLSVDIQYATTSTTHLVLTVK